LKLSSCENASLSESEQLKALRGHSRSPEAGVTGKLV